MKLLGKDGVSEVVGTILLLAIAIATFSVFAIYVMSSTSPSVSSPDLNLVGYINEEQHIVIEHKGGESVKLENIKITVWKGEVDSCMYHFDSNGHLMGENAMFNDSNSNEKWDVGEYIEIDATAVFGNIENWQISATVVDEESNSVIFSGILQPGILRTVPPVAIFTYAPWDPKTGEIVEFNANQSYDPDGGSIVTYRWDFGDGNIGYGVM
ncbi:MAG: type IV pilin, partial [Thermoplasmata archaeon]|nr:type IV pilin [Thermoplasmata archaeon]